MFDKKGLEITKGNLDADEQGLKQLINEAPDGEGLIKAIGRVLDVKHTQEDLLDKVSGEKEGNALKLFAMKLNMLITKGVKRFRIRS